MESQDEKCCFQLILASDIREDLQNMKLEITNTMEWIHIREILLVNKFALFQRVDSLIDIIINDKVVLNHVISFMGTTLNHTFKRNRYLDHR